MTLPEDSGIMNTEGDVMLTMITGASGAIPRDDLERQDRHAALYYEEIRKRTNDIESIAENTGFSTEDVEKIKAHVFLNKYDLGDEELSRFTPDYDMAVSWQRLIEGKNIQEMDIVLLHHELMEYALMNEKGLSYMEAHDTTQKIHNYKKYVNELDRRARENESAGT